jgi:hypothetical protein
MRSIAEKRNRLLPGRVCKACLRGISKDMHDAYWLSRRKHNQFSNTKMDLTALILLDKTDGDAADRI